MRLRWKMLLAQVAICLVTEVVFNCVGIDDLANYSEFILDRKQALIEARFLSHLLSQHVGIVPEIQ